MRWVWEFIPIILPAYARGLTDAAAAGVEVLARACEITPQGVTLAGSVPWVGANLSPTTRPDR